MGMKKAASYASFDRSERSPLLDFLFNFDSHNMPYGICGKIPLFARVFTAHQGSFLKSSKLVVNSTCTLANILVFQGVWGLIIKVWEKIIQKKSNYHCSFSNWQRPTFPGSRPPSIISATELNFCVRDGYRCSLRAIVTRFSCFALFHSSYFF